MNRETFGQRLRRIRLDAGRTLRDLAAVMGDKSIPYVSDVERGHRNPPPARVIRTIGEYLGASDDEIDELLNLAALHRGEMTLNPKSDKEREVVVALQRRIEEGALDDDLAEEIRKILRGR